MKNLLIILIILLTFLNIKANDSISIDYQEFKYEFIHSELSQDYKITYSFNDYIKGQRSLNEPFIWAGVATMGVCLMVNTFNYRAYVTNPYRDQDLSFTEIRKDTKLTLFNISCITTSTCLIFYHYVYNF